MKVSLLPRGGGGLSLLSLALLSLSCSSSWRGLIKG